ncbi:MAG TPA: 16S rRNA processing protein RimM [Lacibacter sp.]|nr:16S rRNA processing protein RimM [Lacibacter sp.]HMO88876.1 16S rRNA processing protein RimM [Lacibacter sp.]HMP86308.1 16S rRNA processing protein RimM [Lacibacter sp.]
MEQYFSIGHIAATHGLQGEVVLKHHLGKKTALKGLEVFFMEEGKDRFLPYFITGTRIKNEAEVFLSIEGIATKEAARLLATRKVWLREADFYKHAGKAAPISLIGYLLLDGKKELGIIREVIEQPLQILCRLEIEGCEVLIPLHEETIRQVNHRKKQVVTELPDGLLDVYLS